MCKNLFGKDKAVHSLAVANFMKSWAPAVGVNENDAWLIGYLHDIGYILDKEGHSVLGSDMLSQHSEYLADYVRRHDTTEPIRDNMEFLLKLADLSVDGNGNFVGVISRIRSLRLSSGSSYKRDVIYLQIDLLKDYAKANDLVDVLTDCF